jgi:hypothetical protein
MSSSYTLDDAVTSLYQQNLQKLSTIDPATGASITSTSDLVTAQLDNSIASLNLYMTNLFKQHNQTTQNLTYANQLFKLESYISNKLSADYKRTVAGTRDISSTVYTVRQKYMDSTSTIWYNYWTMGTLQGTLWFYLIAASLLCLEINGAFNDVIFLILLGTVFLICTIWFYYRIDSYSRRDRLDPNVYLWSVNTGLANSSSSNSCNS